MEHAGIRYETGQVVLWPGTYGSHNWPPMVFQPALGVGLYPHDPYGRCVTVISGPIGGTAAYIPGNKRFESDYRDPRRVLTFALDADASLPTLAHRGARQPQPAGSAEAPDARLVEEGAKIYALHCTQCHGLDAVSGGAGPDLRFSPMIRSKEGFDSLVRGGSLVSLGMPKFADLSAPDSEAIRNFLLCQAKSCTSARP